MFKGTPGPWTFVPFKRHEDSWRDQEGDMGGFLDASGNWVCHFGDSTTYYPTEGSPPSEANARLIAAAPDLLAALEAIKWRAHATSYGMGEDVARMAEEAIAKTAGEQP